MDLITFKLLALLLVFLAGLVGARLPWISWLRRSGPQSDTFVSLGNSFAGGVLLGAGLIHMMGDAADAFSETWPTMDYPAAYLIAGFGFLLILFVERVAVRSHSLSEVELVPQTAASRPAVLYAGILLLALSVHSVFAGLALGLQGSTGSSLAILLAILAHKTVAAFALSVSFVREGRTGRQSVRALLLFCAMTPLGIVLGILLHAGATQAVDQRIEAVFNAVAAGTFLYIAALDIMAEEFLRPGAKWKKFGCCLTGFLIMAVVAIWT